MTASSKAFLFQLLSFLSILVLIVGFQYLNAGSGQPFSVVNSIWVGIGGSFLMSGLMQAPIHNFIKSCLKHLTPQFILDYQHEEFCQLKSLVENNKKFYTDSQKKKLDKMLTKYQEGLENKDEKNNKALSEDIKKIASLTNKINKIEKKGPQIESEMDELIYIYPDKLKKSIDNLVQQIYININDDKNKKNARIAPIFLYGPPGVGKTYFIKKIAKILNIPCYKINSAKLDPNIIIGGLDMSGVAHFGLVFDALYYAYSQEKSNNVILFLDEIDKAFKGKSTWKVNTFETFLLEILDVELKKYNCPPLSCNIDCSKLIIVCAGNSRFSDQYEAMNDRLRFLEFDALDDISKKKIAINYLAKMNARYSLPNNDDEQYINEAIAIDNSPGIRTVKFILKNYIDYKRGQKILIDWQRKPLFFSVKDSYQEYQQSTEIKKDDEPKTEQKEAKEIIQQVADIQTEISLLAIN